MCSWDTVTEDVFSRQRKLLVVLYKHLARHHLICFRNSNLFEEKTEEIVQRQAPRMKGGIGVSLEKA